MGEWSDMEYDMGFLDYNGNILVDDINEITDNTNNLEEEYIEVHLTPSKYLSSEEKYIRTNLINNKLNNSQINLEVFHDKYNNYDPLAIEVYCNKTMIGYIRKDTSKIDTFCFENNKIKNLSLQWENNKFLLYNNKWNKQEIHKKKDSRIYQVSEFKKKIEQLTEELLYQKNKNNLLNLKIKKIENEPIVWTETMIKEKELELEKQKKLFDKKYKELLEKKENIKYESNYLNNLIQKLREDKRVMLYKFFSPEFDTLIIGIGNFKTEYSFSHNIKILNIRGYQQNLFLNNVLINEKPSHYAFDRDFLSPIPGKTLTLKYEQELKTIFKNAKNIFIITQLNDIYCIGMLPEILRIIKELKINFNKAIVTLPYKFQGKKAEAYSKELLSELKKYTSSILSFNNNSVLEHRPKLGMKESEEFQEKIIFNYISKNVDFHQDSFINVDSKYFTVEWDRGIF